ncbi:aldose 1-epimerase [Polychaeton citri CBS 116435]|uniref:Aldose 1-epimerase n=1 Tax=Polychaeton citri CBS 116435 TaxID=1314669 RepID=A0A9P4QHS8_9PEZI|nr:aldose 1-epimerase [Polychaeton citri CBS 116435]
MKYTAIAAIAALPALSAAANFSSSAGPDGKYELSSEGIRAKFIPYGALVSNIFITDVHGIERDIVLGYDNASHYSVDPLHPHLNSIPGRYANRIGNASFTIDGVKYHINPNDAGGLDSLHAGSPCWVLSEEQQAYCSIGGWDWRNWTVTALNSSSISMGLVDPAGTNGFPGEVVANVTYTLTPHKWHLSMTAKATTAKTPIMLTSHTYMNLDGFQNPDTDLALDHRVFLPFSGTRVGTDGTQIPDGTLLPNKQGSVNDFWSAPKALRTGWTDPALMDNCGTGCKGYDNNFIVNRDQYAPYDWRDAAVAQAASPFSGIQVDIFTDQGTAQLFTCNSFNGTLPVKETQGFFDDPNHPRVIQQHGCVVFEVQDYIDGVNHPEWQRRSVYGPEDPPYRFEAIYQFTVNRTLAGLDGNGTAAYS